MDLSSFDSLGQRRVFFVMLLLAATLAAMTPPWGVLAFFIAAGFLGMIASAVEADLKKKCDEKRIVLNVTKWRFAALAMTFICAVIIAQTYANWTTASYSTWVKLGPAAFSLVVYVFFLYKMSQATKHPQTA